MTGRQLRMYCSCGPLYYFFFLKCCYACFPVKKLPPLFRFYYNTYRCIFINVKHLFTITVMTTKFLLLNKY